MNDRRPGLPSNSAKGKPRLLDQLRQKCRVLHYSLHTEKSYVAWIRHFILFHGKCHPQQKGQTKVESLPVNGADCSVQFLHKLDSGRFHQRQLDKARLAGRVIDALRGLAVIARLGPEDVGNKGLRIAIVEREPT